MPNMATAVSGHNAKLLREDRPIDVQQLCNCRGGPQNCPFGGKCLEGVLYYNWATVTQVPDGKKEIYTGVTGRIFKKRLYEHNADMMKGETRTKSTLSSHIYNLKNSGLNFEVSWEIKERSSAYNSTTKKCRICLKEKLHILYQREGATLNRKITTRLYKVSTSSTPYFTMS